LRRRQIHLRDVAVTTIFEPKPKRVKKHLHLFARGVLRLVAGLMKRIIQVCA